MLTSIFFSLTFVHRLVFSAIRVSKLRLNNTPLRVEGTGGEGSGTPIYGIVRYVLPDRLLFWGVYILK